METAYQTKVPANMLEPEGLPKASPAATASATDAPVAAEEAPAAKETPAAKEAPADDATADEPTSSDGEGDSGPVEPAGGFWGREDAEGWLHGLEALGGHMAPKSLVRCLDGMDLNDQ